jgi:hypothetical protein
LHAQSAAALDDFANHGIRETRFDAVAQSLVLESGHGNRAYARRKTGVADRLVAFGCAKRKGECHRYQSGAPRFVFPRQFKHFGFLDNSF